MRDRAIRQGGGRVGGRPGRRIAAAPTDAGDTAPGPGETIPSLARTGPRKAILHIGTEKTGSSSIQTVLQAVRGDLAAHGVAYPEAMGERNHTRLALYASMRDGGDESLARMEDQVSGRAATISRWLPRKLGRELAELPEGVGTVIFSNEHCHSRLRSLAAVRAVKELLEPFFDSFEILVYLRRQDEMAVSRFTTVLRGGSDNPDILSLHRDPTAAYYDYAALLDRWGTVFGRAALRPRIFARSELLQGDVVQDFLHACGVEGLAIPEQKAAQNTALAAEAQEFLRQFNAVYRRQHNGARPREVLNFLSRRFSGKGAQPTRAAAEAFHDRFAEGNERIRREFFPDRESLFSLDFSRYPESVEPPGPAVVASIAGEVAAFVEALPQRRRGKRDDLAAALEAAQSLVAA